MRDAIYDLVSEDTDLMAILTGGLFNRGTIGRQATPDAFDSVGKVKPCAVITMSARSSLGRHDEADQFFQVYFYQQSGYDQIDLALERAYDLLEGQTVTPTEGFCYEIRHANDLGDSEDQALGCSMNMSRYRAILTRRT